VIARRVVDATTTPASPLRAIAVDVEDASAVDE
jgi:hypothetical protein